MHEWYSDPFTCFIQIKADSLVKCRQTLRIMSYVHPEQFFQEDNWICNEVNLFFHLSSPLFLVKDRRAIWGHGKVLLETELVNWPVFCALFR